MGKDAHKQSVLVVDDECNIRRAVQYILEHQGFAVDSAADGQEAIAKIQQEPPDLVLLDIKMPNGNGYDVCQSIRSDGGLSHVKILMLSACCKDIAIEKAMALGADGYVTKPFCTADLISTVNRYFAQGDVEHA